MMRRSYSTTVASLAAAGKQRYTKSLQPLLSQQLNDMKEAGTFKQERVITSPQEASIGVTTSKDKVLNFCANNYLGLSNHPSLIKAAKQTLDDHGLGMSSVRFICGTQDIHKQLEEKLTQFHGTEETILYPSCFDANGGLFEGILSSEDAVISDALNHASIIDGIRLCKAQRYRYNHLDMNDLEKNLQLAEEKGARVKLIATDGVFSMDGDIAPLDKIVQLAEKYNAIIFVDECHATGFFGKHGRGTPEYFGVESEIDIINSTLGKALGGASGGYTTGRREIVDILRQRSRPYLFSNSIAPPIVGAAIKTIDMLIESTELRDRLMSNTQKFRSSLSKYGFTVAGHKDCPIVPVMLFDAKMAAQFADEMLKKGIYVIAFSYPVVPKGQARIRVQISADHTDEQMERVISAFAEVGKQFKVIQ